MVKFPEKLLLVFLIIHGNVFSQEFFPENNKILADSILSTRGEVYLAFPASVRKSVFEITPFLVPDKQTDSLNYFYLNSDQFRQIIGAGIEYQVFTAPSMLAPVRMAKNSDEILEGQAYPSYMQYLDLMKQFRDNYPEICTIDTIGYSIGGRLILAARIQNGDYIEGDRPVVFYSSSMHGDETVGYSLMLMLINEILEKSESSEEISEIVNELVLIINPLSNPDGAYFQSDTSLFGAKRYNLNNIDLNRDFPDVRLGITYTYAGLQKENLVMVKYMEKYPPALSANLHTGAEVLNYPWDTWYSGERKHADNEWFINICKDYVDTARSIDPLYLRLYPEGYVFGSDWYWIPGGRQDFVTYNLRGREITMELSSIKFPEVSQIPDFWEKNRSSLIHYISNAKYGLFGLVTDSISLKPMKVRVEIPVYDKDESHIFSHKTTGKFFRFLPGGTYKMQLSADGYHTQNLSVDISGKQRLDIHIRMKPVLREIIIKSIPGSGEIGIELIDDSSEVFFADLYDISGRKVQETIFLGSSGTMGGTGFHGIYILRVRSDFQTVSRLVFF